MEELFGKYENLIKKYSYGDDERGQYIRIKLWKFYEKHKGEEFVDKDNVNHPLFVYKLKKCVELASLEYNKTAFKFTDSCEDVVEASYEVDLDNKMLITKILKSAISKLDSEEIFIINEYYFSGKSDNEISKELNKPRTTIRDRRKKILLKMRETLLDLGIDEDVLL